MIIYKIWQIYAMTILMSYEIRQAIKIAKAEDGDTIIKEFLKGMVILPILTFIAIQK